MNEEQFREIKERHEQGEPLLPIALSMGIPYSTVYTWWRRGGVYPLRGQAKLDLDKLVKHLETHTMRDTAAHFGVAQCTVRDFLRVHGIESKDLTKIRAKRAPVLDIDSVVSLRKSGMTQAEIGRRFGRSQKDISLFMVANGYRCINRSKSAAPKEGA